MSRTAPTGPVITGPDSLSPWLDQGNYWSSSPNPPTKAQLQSHFSGRAGWGNDFDLMTALGCDDVELAWLMSGAAFTAADAAGYPVWLPDCALPAAAVKLRKRVFALAWAVSQGAVPASQVAEKVYALPRSGAADAERVRRIRSRMDGGKLAPQRMMHPEDRIARLTGAGVSVEDVAAVVGVPDKQMERWLTCPYSELPTGDTAFDTFRSALWGLGSAFRDEHGENRKKPHTPKRDGDPTKVIAFAGNHGKDVF